MTACVSNSIELTIGSETDCWYRTEFTESLILGNWTNINDQCATGEESCVIHPVQTDAGFYRIQNYRP